MIDRVGGPVDGQLQVVAVARDGRKGSSDHNPHFFNFLDDRMVFQFDLDPDEIDHLEFRPFGGRHTFYFEGVRLPTASRSPFASAPIVTLPVDGKPTRQYITQYDPIEVGFELRGATEVQISGISGDGYLVSERLQPRLGGAFNARLVVSGLASTGWNLGFLGMDGEPLKPGSAHICSSGGSGGFQGDWGLDLPLEQVGSIRIAPPPR